MPSGRSWPIPPLVHDGPVTSAVFSADGGRIATSSADGTARVWDAATGKTLHSFRAGGPVARVAFSPDGKTLAAAVGQTVCRWDTTTGEPVSEPLAIGGRTDYVAYSPEGSKLLTVTLAGKARVWDAATGKALSEPLPFFRFGEKEFRMQLPFIQSMEWQRWPAFSADGKQLATCDGLNIHIWSAGGSRIIRPTDSKSPVQIQAAFSPGGTHLIYTARYGNSEVTIHDLAANKVVARGVLPRQVAGLAVSPDGKRAAASLSVGNTVLFNLPAATRSGPFCRIPDWVSRVQYTRDSRRLLTASWDGTVRLWEPPVPVRNAPYRRDSGRADRLEFPDRRFSADGSWVAVADAQRQLRTGRVGAELVLLPRRPVERYCFSPVGPHLATYYRDAKDQRMVIESWELGDTGPKAVGAATVEGRVRDLVFSANGRRLGISATSRKFKQIGAGSVVDQFFVFDFPSLERVFGPVGEGLPRLTGGFALAGDGGMLVVGQVGALQLACWDVRTGKRLPGAAIRPGIVYSLDVGLRDDRVIAGVSDRTITQWDARTGRRAGPTVLLPVGHPTTFSTATYSPDQTRIATTAELVVAGMPQSRVSVFSAVDGDLLATITLSHYLHLPDVWFSADSQRVILHQRGTTEAWACTLPSYRGPLDQVPALVRLLTGMGSDPIGGSFPLGGDAIRSDPESYRRAFRAWKGLAEGE